MSFTAADITLIDLGYTWPDGDVALSGVTGRFGTGRTGLVGANGSGKSTLLRLIAGELNPSAGSIQTSGAVSYLPQTLTLHAQTTVADLLGISAKLAALQAIENGDVADAHFETIGDDWDIEARALAATPEPRCRACCPAGPAPSSWSATTSTCWTRWTTPPSCTTAR